MGQLFNICTGLSMGILLGGFLGGITRAVRRKHYTEKQLETGRRLWKTGSRIMKFVTLLFLALGFIWCGYFLILGIVLPEKSDYANNMSELIVSVLTVVSIAFAFFEFIRKR